MAARFSESEASRVADSYEVDAEAVKRLAKAKGVEGVERTAALLGIHYTTYWRTMTGRTTISAATALQWADRLNCQVHDLYKRVV
jgi:transcriptional regulator with XRE-family HTH domain